MQIEVTLESAAGHTEKNRQKRRPDPVFIVGMSDCLEHNGQMDRLGTLEEPRLFVAASLG